jgi:hypothetical protein
MLVLIKACKCYSKQYSPDSSTLIVQFGEFFYVVNINCQDTSSFITYSRSRTSQNKEVWWCGERIAVHRSKSEKLYIKYWYHSSILKRGKCSVILKVFMKRNICITKNTLILHIKLRCYIWKKPTLIWKGLSSPQNCSVLSHQLPPPHALFRANLRAVQICGPLLET